MSDETTEGIQQLPADDDVEGHCAAYSADGTKIGDQDDVEGHRFRGTDTDTDTDDVEGHRFRGTDTEEIEDEAAGAEDDVEGHRFRGPDGDASEAEDGRGRRVI